MVCDRCGSEMNEEDIDGGKLDVSLTFDDPHSSRLLPLRRREALELCPDCRTDFADWLGERGDIIAGLRPESASAERTLQATVPEDEG